MDKCPVCRLPIDAEHHPQCEIKKALDAGKEGGCNTCTYRPTIRELCAACGIATYECETSLKRLFEDCEPWPACSMFKFDDEAEEPELFWPQKGGGVKSLEPWRP